MKERRSYSRNRDEKDEKWIRRTNKADKTKKVNGKHENKAEIGIKISKRIKQRKGRRKSRAKAFTRGNQKWGKERNEGKKEEATGVKATGKRR